MVREARRGVHTCEPAARVDAGGVQGLVPRVSSNLWQVLGQLRVRHGGAVALPGMFNPTFTSQYVKQKQTRHCTSGIQFTHSLNAPGFNPKRLVSFQPLNPEM